MLGVEGPKGLPGRHPGQNTLEKQQRPRHSGLLGMRGRAGFGSSTKPTYNMAKGKDKRT